MAAKILEKRARENNLDIQIKSAGIATGEGYPASNHARTIIKEYGMEDKHATQRVSEELLEWANLVLTMTIDHKRILIEQAPEWVDKIFSLKEFVLSGSEWKEQQETLDKLNTEALSSIDITDPYGGDIIEYRKTAKEIEESINKLILSMKFK